jgi:MFS family permease
VGAFASLRHRDYRLMWIGSALSNTGTWMMWVALSWHVLQLTHSAFWVGAINFANFFPMWLSPLGGVLADRFDRKKVLLVTQSVMMVDGAALAVLAGTGHATLWPVLLLTLILGFVFAMDAPARHALFPTLVPRETMVNAIALNSAQFSLARVIGPAIAGPLVATVGVTPVFWANAGSFLAVLVALWLIRSPYRGPEAGQPRVTILDGVRYAWRHPLVRAMLLAILVYSLFGAPIQALLPVFADEVFARGARGFGLLAAAMGAGSVVGAVVLGLLGRVSVRIVGVGLALSGASLIAFASVGSFALAVPLVLVFGGMYLFSISAMNSRIQTSVDDAMRGRVVGLFMMVFGGVFPVGGLIGGAIADRIGAPLTTGVGAAVVLLWGLGLAWRNRAMAVDRTSGDAQRPSHTAQGDGGQAGRDPRATSEASARGGPPSAAIAEEQEGSDDGSGRGDAHPARDPQAETRPG